MVHNSLFSSLLWTLVAALLLQKIRATSGFDLTVLHTNDLHSRFDEITASGSACQDKDRREGECLGGVARLKAAVDKARAEVENSIFINAGDFFQGTLWYSMFKWPLVANLTSQLGYEATSLGNHEFDDGIADLVSFVKATRQSFPTLACNLNLDREPELARNIRGSMVAHVGPARHRVGIVGYVTPDTQFLSSTGNVVFLDEVDSIRKEVARLQADGLKVIVALGHSGYKLDQKIAAEVSGLSAVVGGHTNTFLSKRPPKVPPPHGHPHSVGPYPTMVKNEQTGLYVPVVQTSGYGRYLGRLRLSLDDQGRVLNATGHPVLLKQSLPQDPDLARQVAVYSGRLSKKMDVEVGSTDVFLDGGRPRCRLEECPVGNLITDAMASQMGVGIALMNSGAIKGSFEEGPITLGDVYTIMPWSNTIDVISLPGHTLKRVLEHAVEDYNDPPEDPPGTYLQASGLHIVYNVTRPIGHRLVSAKVIVQSEPELVQEDVDDYAVYELAVPSFMVKGGDSYNMIPKQLVEHRNTGFLDNDLIVTYIRENSPLQMPTTGRVRFVENTGDSDSPPSSADGLSAQTKALSSLVTHALLMLVGTALEFF